MASQRVTGTQWTCDGCDVTEFVPDSSATIVENAPDPGPPAEWIRGTVDAGPVGGQWVAHHTKCIQKAVNSIINPGGS